MISWVACLGFWQLLLAWVGAPPENYYNAANRLFEAGDLHSAEKLYQGVWKKPGVLSAVLPNRAEAVRKIKFKALYNAGNAAYLQEHWALAIQDYEAALRLDSGDEDAWNNLGLAQARLQGKVENLEGPEKSAGSRPGKEPSPVDIFSLPPDALAEYLQSLTRAGYPFRPGSSLQPAPAPPGPPDEVDW